MKYKIITATIISGLLIRIFLSLYIPAFYAPDEKPHYKYIVYLMKYKKLPIQTSKTDDPTYDWEYYQPPLYYLLLSFFLTSLSHINLNSDVSFYLIRMFSILLWLIGALIYVKLFAYLNFKYEEKLFFFSIYSFLPSFVYLTSVINNDNLLNFFFPIILLVLSTRIKGKELLLGFILALSLMTKLTAIIYIFFTFLYLLFYEKSFKKALLKFFVICSIILFLSLPWFIRNLHIYNSFTGFDIVNKKIYLNPFTAFNNIWSTFFAAAGYHNEIRFLHIFNIFLGYYLFFTITLGFYLSLKNKFLKFPFISFITFYLQFILVLKVACEYRQPQGRFLFCILFLIIYNLLFTFKNLKIDIKRLSHLTLFLSIIYLIGYLIKVFTYIKTHPFYMRG